jgi:hypothetical protein
MDSEELLEQLADIHLPLEISYWPPAPGWWVLAFLLLAGIIFLINRYIEHHTQKKICRYALAELENCLHDFSKDEKILDVNSLRIRYVNSFNSVIRRVALVHYPEENVASLSGDSWVDFIREKGNTPQISEEIAAALSFGRFQSECNFDIHEMNNLGKAWITALYLKPNQKKSDKQGKITDA